MLSGRLLVNLGRRSCHGNVCRMVSHVVTVPSMGESITGKMLVVFGSFSISLMRTVHRRDSDRMGERRRRYSGYRRSGRCYRNRQGKATVFILLLHSLIQRRLALM